MTEQAEHRLQRAVAQHLTLRHAPGIWWTSIDHASRDRILNATRKARGVKPGIPDIIVLMRGSLYCLELKTSTGRQSPEQKAVEAEILRAGGVYEVAHGIDEALYILEAWGALKPNAVKARPALPVARAA
jgi:hypothetical protein